MGRHRKTAWMAILLVGSTAFTLEAQSPDGPWGSYRSHDAPRAHLGLGFVVAQPVGEFDRYVDQGYGGQLNARFRLDPEGWLNLRTDVGFVIYGRETLHFCSPFGCRVDLDLTTTNSIVFAGIGPEIVVPGEWARPYFFGTFGLGYFSTASSLGGSDSGVDYARTVNFDDAVFQSRVGGGIELRLRDGPKPIYLDFGAQYHANGQAEYLREGDIRDNPDGSITLFPRRSDANLMTFRLGVTFGLGGDDDVHRRRGRR